MISPQPITPRPTRAANFVPPHTTRAMSGRSHDARIVRQFRRLADNIAKEFPCLSGGTLLFSGAGSSNHIAEVAQQVARQLAFQSDIMVALVDGDGANQVLSKRLAPDANGGLAEVLQLQTSLPSAMTPTETPDLHFLPFGDRRTARNPIAPDAIRSLLADLRQLHRYVVIAAGADTSKMQAMLGRHCDGTYLVVQIGTAQRQETSDLARYLSRAGARLLGCVATSVA